MNTEEKNGVAQVNYHVLGPHVSPEKETVEKKNMSEQSYASPIINNIPDGDGNRNGGMEGALAGILPLAFLAPLLKGFNGENNGGRNIEAVIAEQLGNLRKDVSDSTVNGLKQSFQAEKDAIIAGFKAQLETEKAINKIENKIGECCEETSNKLFAIEKTMDNKFCEMSHQVERGFAHVAERELSETLRREREENASLKETIRDRSLLTDLLTSIGVVSPILPLAKKV